MDSRSSVASTNKVSNRKGLIEEIDALFQLSLQDGNLTKFTLFPELPVEIRLKIWRHALHGPAYMQTGTCTQDECNTIQTQDLGIMRACKESRTEALRHVMVLPTFVSRPSLEPTGDEVGIPTMRPRFVIQFFHHKRDILRYYFLRPPAPQSMLGNSLGAAQRNAQNARCTSRATRLHVHNVVFLRLGTAPLEASLGSVERILNRAKSLLELRLELSERQMTVLEGASIQRKVVAIIGHMTRLRSYVQRLKDEDPTRTLPTIILCAYRPESIKLLSNNEPDQLVDFVLENGRWSMKLTTEGEQAIDNAVLSQTDVVQDELQLSKQ